MNTALKTELLSARRKLIENYFSHLNPMQREAVLKTEGALLILAGAGSGKTTVLINRIANLIKFGVASESDYIPDYYGEEELNILRAGGPEAEALAALEPCHPWQIIAITFTNKAADVLKSRLASMLGSAANDIWARTFHSACVRILRRFADRLGYDLNFTIYDSSERITVMKGILKDLDLDPKVFDPKYLLNRIDKLKDDLISAESFLEESEKSFDPKERALGRIYKTYDKKLFEASAMDFEDLLYNTVRLLKEHNDVLHLYQRQFKYVLIDEYQDTNNLQYQLASLLAGGYGNICVVGDDDQSIYKFRGASIKNILNFENEFEGCTTIRLEQNYRSTSNILAAANELIKNNKERKGKTLWTSEEDGEKIHLHTAENEDAEAQFVADKILENYTKDNTFSNNMILYRMNAQSNRLEFAFKRNGIPYKVYGGIRFYDRAEVKDMLAYLSVILSPADELRLLRIINTPRRGIGDKTIETCLNISSNSIYSLYDIISRANEYDELRKSAPRLLEFYTLIESLRESSKTLALDELYEEVLFRTSYLKQLEMNPSVENKSKIENIGELLTNIKTYMSESPDKSLEGFLDEVSLYTDLDNMQTEDVDNAAVMMTMHSSKGLECKNVFMIGVEEGIFPGIKSLGDEEEMEEERRLCYVAITRARERLYISSAKQRMLFGKTNLNLPSRFIDEIPDNLFERSGIAPYRRSPQSSFIKSENLVPGQSLRRAPTLLANSDALKGFKEGDRVRHRVFGSGKIISVKPSGNDALLQIVFDTVGKKLLMLRSAANYMTLEE